MLIVILLILIFKHLFKPKYYKKKTKVQKKDNLFIPYTTHNKKPTWVKNEIIYLKVYLANYGCIKIAIEFNKKYAHKKITVSKSYVYNIIKANNYEIIKQRKELKNRVPKPIPKNLIWSMDLSTIKEQQIFGLIDNGSRALISL